MLSKKVLPTPKGGRACAGVGAGAPGLLQQRPDLQDWLSRRGARASRPNSRLGLAPSGEALSFLPGRVI